MENRYNKMVKMSKIEEKIRSSKILKDLDEETIDSIKTIVASSDNYKDKVCKKLLEETTEMCFEETERLFEPYIDCHKNVQNLINDVLIDLQQKNSKRITTCEDIENAENVFMKACVYLNYMLPMNLKELKKEKDEYSVTKMNRDIRASALSKPMRIKMLSLSYKLVNFGMQLHSIFEEELNGTVIEDLNSFLGIEIEVARKIQIESNCDIENIYEDVIFEELEKVPIQYKTPSTYTELAKIAQENGFYFCRQGKTSHAIYKNDNNKIIVIPNKGKVTVPIGTQFQILKRIFVS